MNSRTSQSHSSRRGPRRRSHKSRSFTPREQTPAPPKTLWQRVTAFFGAGKSKSSTPALKPTVHPTDEAAARRTATASSNGNQRANSTRSVSRKPEMVEVSTPRLYVGNLSFDAAESDLSELFNGVGQVVSVEVVTHKQTQRSKGFAFVQMQSVEEAKRAVSELHDKEFMGRKLVVSGAKNSDQAGARVES